MDKMSVENKTVICECGLEKDVMSIHLHQYCEFNYKVTDSNVTIQCLKFLNHKGKHYIFGMNYG